MKVCTKCKIEKPLDAFGKSSRSKDGLRGDCKACRETEREGPNRKAYLEQKRKNNAKHADARAEKQRRYNIEHCAERKAYLAANKERTLATGRAYRKARQEELTAYMREWRENNREHIEEYNKDYRAAPDYQQRKAQWKKDWDAKNPHKSSEYSHQRRARKLAAPYDNGINVTALRERDGDQCIYCGVVMDFTDYESLHYRHIEHFMPLAKGGTHTWDNCWLACKICNQRKHATHPIEFLELSDEDIETCKQIASCFD